MRAMPSGFFCRQRAWIRTGPSLVSQTFSGKLPPSISPVAVVPVRRSNAAAARPTEHSRAPGKIGLTSQPDFAAINPLAADNANAG